MANNRFQLKQFAGNASNNGVFGSYSAGTSESSSDAETIQSLPAWLNGWSEATTSASILPRLEEMQGVQYVLCKAILENDKEGIPSWLATETYYQYSICGYADETHAFNVYINMTGNFTTTNPAQDTTNWQTFADFFNLATPEVLNQKADIDLSNLNQQGNNAISAPLYSHLSDFILEAPNGIVETQSNYIAWTQPVYTSNTSYGSITLDDGDMENLWHAFDSNNITFAVVQGASISGTFTVNYPTKKKVSHIYIYNGQESGTYQGLANIKVYAINDGQSTLILDLNGSGATTNIWDEDVSNVVCDSLQFIATRPSTGYSSAINTITVSAQSLEPNTIVVKQGVKVLMPNGFNADGTYKNIEYALTSDKTQTIASNYAVNGLIGIINGGIQAFSFELLKTDYFPTASNYQTYGLYRTDLNKTYRAQNVSGTYQWVETPFAIICRYVHNKGSITTIQPVGVGRIDTARNTFINASPNLTRTQSLTIRSGVTYYMPFDGYLFVNGAGASGMHITVDGVEVYYSGAAGSTSNIIPIQFGGKIVSTGNISGCWLAPAVCYK